MYKVFRGLALFLWLHHLVLVGQGTGNNPYSRYGLGEIYTLNGSVRNIGMGYSGVAGRPYMNSQYTLHLLNPAHLGFFRKAPRMDGSARFEMAFTSQLRSLNTTTSSQSSFGTNLGYLNMAFPLSKVWGTSIGVLPFSTTDYNITTEETIEDAILTTRREGRGGIYKIYWSNGIGISKWATIGLESALLYGNVNDKVLSNISTLNTLYSGFNVRNRYSGWQLKPGISLHKELFYKKADSVLVETAQGLQYKDTIRKASTGYLINAGLTYDFFPSMETIRYVNLFSVTEANTIVDDSTVGRSAQDLSMPGMLKGGLSLEKKFAPFARNHWLINADLSYTNWSSLNGTSGSSLEGDTLFNTLGIHVGGEFTPLLKNKKSEIRKRYKTYRLGFSYTQLPVQIQGQTINDMSVSIGATVPVGRIIKTEAGNQILPRINLALVLGQRGTTSYGLIQENYFRIYASLLINEVWFQKRRID